MAELTYRDAVARGIAQEMERALRATMNKGAIPLPLREALTPVAE